MKHLQTLAVIFAGLFDLNLKLFEAKFIRPLENQMDNYQVYQVTELNQNGPKFNQLTFFSTIKTTRLWVTDRVSNITVCIRYQCRKTTVFY